MPFRILMLRNATCTTASASFRVCGFARSALRLDVIEEAGMLDTLFTTHSAMDPRHGVELVIALPSYVLFAPFV